MSFLDTLKRKFAGGIEGREGEQGGLVEGVMGFLTSRETGGLDGLVQAFKERGLGDVISSWVGTGENAAITPQQVQDVLGSDVVGRLAEKANISEDEVKSRLSQLLPDLIDRITPEGKIPEGGYLDKGRELLRGLFAKG